jgi:hypothetical protein
MLNKNRSFIRAMETHDATAVFTINRIAPQSEPSHARAAGPGTSRISTVEEGGRIQFIDVECVCGERILIELQYAAEAVPAGRPLPVAVAR